MKTSISHHFAHSLATLLIIMFTVSPAWATCGGGGGGGGGGMPGSGGGPSPEVYYVPWKVRALKDPPAKGLILYWFPLTKDELQRSSMRVSRTLTLYATQCVSMELADYRSSAAQKLIGDSQPPVAVLAAPDGSAVNKVEKNKEGRLKVDQVEKMLDGEMKQRESALETQLKDAKSKATSGDKEGAIKLFQAVIEQKCLFPKKAKDAAKELKKLGAETARVPESPVFDGPRSTAIQRLMRRGLRAELAERYETAKALYDRARRMDPADPVPLRYLGELYRHHTGEWDKARSTFEGILNMPADPLSRAVALHGLGKMTIHDGEFKKGLALMEQSVEEYPLALAYRNLAVYWNSEGDLARTDEYTRKALTLDPKDPYNLVFAAVFMAASGKGDEALRIARENQALLPASYNLAAIYAQMGQRQKALALLKRHFFQYERYQAVRAKEMMEARVDAVFDSLRYDRAFLALTRGSDGKLAMPMKSVSTGQRQTQQ